MQAKEIVRLIGIITLLFIIISCASFKNVIDLNQNLSNDFKVRLYISTGDEISQIDSVSMNLKSNSGFHMLEVLLPEGEHQLMMSGTFTKPAVKYEYSDYLFSYDFVAGKEYWIHFLEDEKISITIYKTDKKEVINEFIKKGRFTTKTGRLGGM